jgi:hypothetical protein
MQHRIYGESSVQDAIVAALSEYCYSERIRFRHTLPYANQQGFNPNDVCGDLVAAFSELRLLAIEIKAARLNFDKHELQSFKSSQLKKYADLKNSYGLPIFYAYNSVEILSQNKPGDFSPFRCAFTLSEIHLAQPDEVSKEGIVSKRLSTLLEYLQDKKASEADAEKLLVGLLALQTAEISNSILVIAFGKDKGTFNLNIDEIRSLATQMANSYQLIDATRFPLCRQFAEHAYNEKQKKDPELALKVIAEALPSVPQKFDKFGGLSSDLIKKLAIAYSPDGTDGSDISKDNKKNKSKASSGKLKN